MGNHECMYVSLKEIMKITFMILCILYTHVLFFKGILLRLCLLSRVCEVRIFLYTTGWKFCILWVES